jgi:hypothetical protein
MEERSPVQEAAQSNLNGREEVGGAENREGENDDDDDDDKNEEEDKEEEEEEEEEEEQEQEELSDGDDLRVGYLSFFPLNSWH